MKSIEYFLTLFFFRLIDLFAKRSQNLTEIKSNAEHALILTRTGIDFFLNFQTVVCKCSMPKEISIHYLFNKKNTRDKPQCTL